LLHWQAALPLQTGTALVKLISCMQGTAANLQFSFSQKGDLLFDTLHCMVDANYLLIRKSQPLKLVQEPLAESKTGHFSPFFTFFQLRSSGYAPSNAKTDKKSACFCQRQRFLNKLLKNGIDRHFSPVLYPRFRYRFRYISSLVAIPPFFAPNSVNPSYFCRRFDGLASFLLAFPASATVFTIKLNLTG
jgi:hypothetical protein